MKNKTRNNKNSIKFSSIEDEKIAFDKLLALKLKYKSNNDKDYLVIINGKERLRIYSWITNGDEYLISIGKANNYLGKFGYTLQLYYDIFILELTDINQRPKCVICGEPIEFKRFHRGYSKTCSKDCLNKFKQSKKQESFDKNENEIIFNKFYSLNPLKGEKYSDYYYEDSNKLDKNKKPVKYYKLYKWITGEDKDRFVQSNIFPSVLKDYGMSSRIYYDIVILGINSIEDRPKCKVCGNNVEFKGLYSGYKTVCSDSCFKKLSSNRISTYGKMSIKLSEESKEKIRQKALGRKHSADSKRKMSLSRVGKKKNFSKEFKERLIKSNKSRVWSNESREKISKATINRLINGNIGSNQYKRGWYHSEIFNIDIHFDSSWEERFIKMCEILYKKKHIIKFSRCTDIIYYNKDDNSIHRYLPDFKLTLFNGTEVVIELKPATLVKKDRVVYLKKIAALKYYRKQKIKYIILTENELFKNIHGSFNIFDFIV